MEKIILRPETPSDYDQVENLVREAFWNVHSPGCEEHYLMHIMRNAPAFVRELDWIAEYEGKIAGQIAYTKMKIAKDNGTYCDVLCFGPISVLPEFQAKGIGGKLIRHTQNLARQLGYRAILIFGDPAYYSRFGFVPAEQFDIGTEDHAYADALQAYELYENALQDCAGRFLEDAVFHLNADAAAAFDETFPFKEKQSGLESQKRFLELARARKPRPVNSPSA